MDILFDSCVNFIDEVEEIIQETGGQTRNQTIASVDAALPAPRMWESEEVEEQRQSALDSAVARHEAEVEAPALAILRERKAKAAASRTTTTSGAWHKAPVTFAVPGFGNGDAGYYRRLLDGVDPVLPQQLAAAPAVNSLTLRISWPPRHCAAAGFIASAHDDLLALCVGSCYRYNYSYLPGCYLVLDTRAKSVAVVPPLHDAVGGIGCNYSQYPIGSAGVAVVRTDAHDGGGYLLAELYRHNHRDDNFPTNKATLFMWCSPGSGSGDGPRACADQFMWCWCSPGSVSGSGSGGGPRACADQWIRKEVVLPLPDPDEEETFFNFNAGMVFAVSSTSLCWVDLWAGILVCNNISCSTAADDDDGLVFTFIPLPEGCAPAAFGSTEYRSVCCVDSETIKLLCMDDGGEEVTLAITAWTLKFPLSTDGWRWEKDEDASCSSLCVADLLDEAIPVDGGSKRRLLRRVVRWPVVGRAQPGVAHVSVADYEYKRKGRDDDWEGRGCYEVSLDVPRRRVASVFTLPAGSSPAHSVMAL